MENFIVLLQDGKALLFKTYEEAFAASEQYTQDTGFVAYVEQFWSAK